MLTISFMGFLFSTLNVFLMKAVIVSNKLTSFQEIDHVSSNKRHYHLFNFKALRCGPFSENSLTT